MKSPSRALIAYSLISKHLQNGHNAPDIEQALMEFFRAMAFGMAREPFDPEKFCIEARRQFGINIPIPIAKSWAPRLEKSGILKATSTIRAGKEEYKEYVYSEVSELHADNESEIEKVFAAFRSYCRRELSVHLESYQNEQIDDAFLQRLLHLESLKVLAKRHSTPSETTGGIKRTPNTLTLSSKKSSENDVARRAESELETRLDIAVADFLLTAERNQPELFQRISLVAYSNLAVETLIAFAEPPRDSQAFANAQVFFDTPLVLDMLLLHTDREQYGAQFKEMVFNAKIEPYIFEHTLIELEEIINARLNGKNTPTQSTLYIHRVSSETPQTLERLRGMKGAVELELNRIGIKVLADEPLGLASQRAKVVASQGKDIEDKLRASGWAENSVARERDVRSICDIVALRNNKRDIDKIYDVPYIIVSSNTTLVNVANASWKNWLVENKTFNFSRKAPIAIDDRQLSGLIWITCGAPLERISRSRLIANCASALRPSEEATKAVYNMIVDAQGSDDAERFAAIMTDQRAQRMFMKQTAGDSKILARDDLPQFICALEAALISEKTKEFAEKEREIRSEVKQLSEKLSRATKDNHAAQSQLTQRINDDKKRLKTLGTQRETIRKLLHIGISILAAAATLILIPISSYIADIFGYKLFELTKWLMGMALTALGMWKIPDLLFADFCDEKAEQYFLAKVHEAGLSYLLHQASNASREASAADYEEEQKNGIQIATINQ